MAAQPRRPVPITLQVEVYFRDKWLCHVCRLPLVFPFALKQLAELAATDAPQRALAYYNANWRRDKAPLLDELGASIDHVVALARGGAHDIANFAAICARCNARKSSRSLDDFVRQRKPWRVKGKHGEPTTWDGLTSVFVALASTSERPLTAVEREWLRALQAYFAAHGPS